MRDWSEEECSTTEWVFRPELMFAGDEVLQAKALKTMKNLWEIWEGKNKDNEVRLVVVRMHFTITAEVRPRRRLRVVKE